MGLDRVKVDPVAARKLLVWSWILFVHGTVLGALAIVGGLVSVLNLVP
jgi:hypothetical protein